MSNKYPHYRYCSVSWCKNSGRINKPGLHFFRIPVDSRLAAWVAYTGRQDLKTKSANLLKNYRVCSDHFTDRDFMNNVIRDRLTRQAVPSVPSDTKVAVCGPKEARSRSASVANKRLYTCQRTAKRRWKWQSEVGDSSGESLPEQNVPSSVSTEASPLPKVPRSPFSNGNGILLIPDNDFLVIPIDDDRAATAPPLSRSPDDHSCNLEHLQLCLEVGDSSGESLPEQNVPSSASSEASPLPKQVAHSGGESIPEESVPSPASSEVLPLPKVVECYTLQQSNERDHYTYINVVDELGEYCMHPNSSLATWDKYTERLERYCKSINISEDGALRAVLLGCCGKVTNRLIKRLVQPEKPMEVSYSMIKRVVREHLGGKRSPLRARFLFFKRNQEPCESVMDYAMALRKLVKDCDFRGGEVAMDVMLRDRFVFGIRDDALRECLLDKRDLTFDAAYNMTLKAEASSGKQPKTVSVGKDKKNGDDVSHMCIVYS
ncbi:uncharacterized protein LOC119179509 isoform X1 [Rhipicephalus microplus]|uniref:uncharacterized protein LOC119179509 isoform X1 n=1 Tax=Rhipicephalus microplus TaxID=6941 RepID=UPI003F6C41F1